MFVFHWFLLVFGTPGDLGSLGEAGESKIIGFPWFFKVLGGGGEVGRKKKKIKVFGTEGAGAGAAWGEPGEPGSWEVGSRGAGELSWRAGEPGSRGA